MKGKRYNGFLWTVALSLAMVLALTSHVSADGADGITTQDILALVEQLENEEQLTDVRAIRALTMHLTAVSHYEKQEDKDKVVEHMNSFKLLLDHQLSNESMTEQAHASLMESADALIQRWDVLTIVSDGQANAVVIAPNESIDKEVVDWQVWNNVGSNGYANLATGIAHTGQASAALHDMTNGTLTQTFQAEPGPFALKVYYYTPEEGASTIRLGVNIRDDNNTWLGRLQTEEVQTAETAGEWTAMTLQGVIEYEEIETLQVTISVYNQEGVPVYVDDAHLSQQDGANLLLNPGFEEITYGQAVNTFVEYVKKSTGVELPVTTADLLQQNPGAFKDDVRIYIGNQPLGEEGHVDAKLQDLDDTGYLIHPAENSVTILGPSDLGTQYGVYEFLERYIGVSWLQPGELWEVVPQHTDLFIPREDVREEPDFALRSIYAAPAEWADKNRLQTGWTEMPIRFTHNLHSLFPVTEYGETHPEYYPDGNPPLPGDETGWQPCFSVEGTVDVAVSGIIDYFDENPDQTHFSLGVNDSRGYCETDPDHPHYPGEMNSIGAVNMSEIYYEWVNEVVTQVLEVYPDKWFGLLAYGNVMDPPSFPVHPRVVPVLTKDRMTWVDDDVRAASHQRVEAWNEKANQLGWWDYMYGTLYATPRVYPHQLAEIYQFAYDHDVYGTFTEMRSNLGDGPKPWLFAQLLWDPHQDVDVLLQKWYEKAVGTEAAPYLKSYYELWEEIWTERIKGFPWFEENKQNTYLPFTVDPSYIKLVTDEDLATSRNLIATVVDKAQTERQKQRADQLQLMFEYYEATVISYPSDAEVETPTNQEEAIALLDEIKLSLHMAQKRHDLIEQFEDEPALKFHSLPRFDWNGVQHKSFSALQNYVESEPEGGPVGELVDEFLAELPDNLRKAFLRDIPDQFIANAVKTTASKEEILQSFDFSAGPWEDAQSIDDFLVMSTQQIPPIETYLKLLWDDENMYVGYENVDPDAPEVVINGYTGNSNQTFFAAEREGTINGYFTNPAGEQFSYVMDPDSGITSGSNASWETNVQIDDDGWNVVQVIPFSSIGIDPSQTDSFMGLFFRSYNNQSVFIGWGGGAPWNRGDLKPIQLVEQ